SPGPRGGPPVGLPEPPPSATGPGPPPEPVPPPTFPPPEEPQLSTAATTAIVHHRCNATRHPPQPRHAARHLRPKGSTGQTRWHPTGRLERSALDTPRVPCAGPLGRRRGRSRPR